MTDKKVLFVGCSFTATSGFLPENQTKYHWPFLFCQQTGHTMDNRAIGGMSNQEIFSRAVEAVSSQPYDLVIVMWSEVSRLWAYCSNNNVDDFTILNNGFVKGFEQDSVHVIDYAKMHYSHFNNRYIAIKHWLLKCFALEKTLKSLEIPYVFIKGFDNDIRHLNSVSYNNGFNNVDMIKEMLDFDNRPDDYILEKVKVLQDLIHAQDQEHWLNLTSPSFFEMAVDRADDSNHPGAKSNKILSDKLINLYNKLHEQSI